MIAPEDPHAVRLAAGCELHIVRPFMHYDLIGNRLTSTANSVTTSYSSNALNQHSQKSVPSVQSVVPIHDQDGNNPLFPALRSDPKAVSGAFFQKQIPSSISSDK